MHTGFTISTLILIQSIKNQELGAISGATILVRLNRSSIRPRMFFGQVEVIGLLLKIVLSRVIVDFVTVKWGFLRLGILGWTREKDKK